MGSSNPMPAAPSNPYTGLGQANKGALQGINNIANSPNYAANTYNTYSGGLAGSLQGTNYNPQDTVNTGNYMQGQGANMYGQGNTLMNMGLDPQHAYYDQAYQQNQQQTRASLEARGINSSPAGAAQEQQSNQYFNNMWQNQQAARASQLAGAAQGMYGTAGQTMSTGAGLGSGTVSQQYQQMLQMQQAGLMSKVQDQQTVSNYMNYLNQGGQYQLGQYQALLGGQAQQNAQGAAQSQGYGQMAAMAAMAAMMMMSDRRLKTDIKELDTLSDGTPVYTFRYKGDDTYRIGVMAQDILETHPDAVHVIDGYYCVDYSKMGALV